MIFLSKLQTIMSAISEEFGNYIRDLILDRINNTIGNKEDAVMVLNMITEHQQIDQNPLLDIAADRIAEKYQVTV